MFGRFTGVAGFGVLAGLVGIVVVGAGSVTGVVGVWGATEQRKQLRSKRLSLSCLDHGLIF
jgi:hypothetical protein